MAKATKKVPTWKVITKCYAKGTLWYEGDIVEGGDFSKNPCFVKGKDIEVEADEVEASTNNGQDLPPANGSN